ncbi:hypothetical protein ABZS71_34830 [Streptomyces sp. NPDC005393]|uniref:hypothetical protein n=1 Tax=Streptomyces sp. NPDC005393 TaxID=3157041 RepID=UPI0033ACFD05
MASTSARPSLSGLEDLLLYRKSDTVLRPDPTPTTVAAAVDAARRDFNACRYDTLARAIPPRIGLAQALGTNGHPEQAATAVAELYNTATRLCIKLGGDGLAAVTADRRTRGCRHADGRRSPPHDLQRLAPSGALRPRLAV